jgi:hypothetical protein
MYTYINTILFFPFGLHKTHKISLCSCARRIFDLHPKKYYNLFTQPNLCPTVLVLYATCVCLEKYKVWLLYWSHYLYLVILFHHFSYPCLDCFFFSSPLGTEGEKPHEVHPTFPALVQYQSDLRVNSIIYR